MPTTITRLGTSYVPITFTSDAATTAGFSLTQAAGALILVTATSSGSTITLTWRTKADVSLPDSYVLADSSDAPVTQVVQPNRAYAVPASLSSAKYILATTASAGQTVTVRVVTKT
jgi:hypothetical protein